MTREEAWEKVEKDCPTLSRDHQLVLVNLLVGYRPSMPRREGARQKIGGRYVRITAQILPGHIGKRQRIFNSNSKSCQMWRDSEAILRADITYLEGMKLERQLRKEKFDKHFRENIHRYRDNDPSLKEKGKG